MARNDPEDEYEDEYPEPEYPEPEPEPEGPDLSVALPSVGSSPASDPWAGVNLGKASKEQAEDFIRRNPGDYGRIASAFADDNQPKPGSGGGGYSFSGPGVGDYGQYFNQLFGGLQGQFQGYMDQLSKQREEDKARRDLYEKQVRDAIMGLMSQKPPTADEIATGPEAKAYQRLQERSQQLLRAQNAERAAQMGTGGVMVGGQSPQQALSEQGMAGGNMTEPVPGRPEMSAPGTGRGDVGIAGGNMDPLRPELSAPMGGRNPRVSGGEQVQTRGEAPASGGAPPTTELGGALGSSIAQGSRDLAERTNAMQAQVMSRELQARRDQLMQALQLGAGLMTADQQRDLQRELTQIDASLRNTLGQGGLSLGLLGNLLQNQQFGQNLGFQQQQLGQQNDQFYSGLGAQLGYQQAILNQLPYQYLF